MIQVSKCPLCGHDIEIDLGWAAKNGRIFCGTCCKSFEVAVQLPPEPPPIPEEDAYEDIKNLTSKVKEEKKPCPVFNCDGCTCENDPYDWEKMVDCKHCSEKHDEVDQRTGFEAKKKPNSF